MVNGAIPDEVQKEAVKFLQAALPTFNAKLAETTVTNDFVKALVNYPFSGDVYKSEKHKAQEELFNLHLDIFNAKSLILATEMIKLDLEFNKAHLESVVKEMVTSETKEANNG